MNPMSKPAYTTSHQGSRGTGITLPMPLSSESAHQPPLVANSTTGRVRGCDDQMKLKEETKMSTTPKFEQPESHSVGRVGSVSTFYMIHFYEFYLILYKGFDF